MDHDIMSQCWYNAGPTSTTLNQHHTNTVSVCQSYSQSNLTAIYTHVSDKRDYSRFYFVLFTDQITVIGNEMCVYIKICKCLVLN